MILAESGARHGHGMVYKKGACFEIYFQII